MSPHLPTAATLGLVSPVPVLCRCRRPMMFLNSALILSCESDTVASPPGSPPPHTHPGAHGASRPHSGLTLRRMWSPYLGVKAVLTWPSPALWASALLTLSLSGAQLLGVWGSPPPPHPLDAVRSSVVHTLSFYSLFCSPGASPFSSSH